MRRPKLTPLRIALIFGIGLSTMRFNGCMALQLLDTRAVDMRLMHRGVQEASDDVVIVAVDDISLERIGRWPWSRATVARLLDVITAGEPSVVGFDIVQSEAASVPLVQGLRERVEGVDERTWGSVRSALSQWSEEDRELARSVSASGRTVLGYFFDFDEPATGGAAVEVSMYDAVQSSGSGERRVIEADDVVTNLAQLTEAALSTGYFNVFPDRRDGLYRRIPLAIRYADRVAVPLSLSMLAVHWQRAPISIRFADFGVERVRIGPRSIPVAEDGQMLLNFRGPRRTFKHVSAAEILAGRVPAETFRGKLVLVGVTATAVADVRATPFDGVFPGVEIHATAMDNILRDDFLLQPKWVVLVEIASVMLAAVVLGLALRIARGMRGAVVALVLLGAYLVGSQWLFVSAGIPLGLMFPVLAIAAIYGAISLEHFAAEQSEKRQIRDAFGLYLNPELARLVSEQPELLKLGGEKRPLTVLFSDIRSFTSISERLEPEVLVEMLNTYLGEMTDVVFHHDGTLDKYVGDAIMAVWGAPVPQDDHATRACLASLDMLTQLERLGDVWAEHGWPPLEIGIGLHSGEMIVGNMGSSRRLSYTVIGDNVNVGARLEGLTKLYGAPIIVSEETLEEAGDAVVARELDLVQVKGKALPVRIFEILGRGEQAERWTALRLLFADGLAAYRERRWTDAIDAFESVQQRFPDDGPARLYLDRCRELQVADPGPGWQAVAVMDSK